MTRENPHKRKKIVLLNLGNNFHYWCKLSRKLLFYRTIEICFVLNEFQFLQVDLAIFEVYVFKFVIYFVGDAQWQKFRQNYVYKKLSINRG